MEKKTKNQTFEEWFESLTLEEQEEYFEELNAEEWINYYKEHSYYEE